MEQQTKEYSDDINLYDLWKVIVRRRRLIIGLCLVTVISTTIVSFLMPKIYRGEAVLSIWQNEAVSMSLMAEKEVMPQKEIIPARDIAEIIGNIDNDKKIKILPKTHASVTDIKLRVLKETKDKFIVIIDAKNIDDIPKALTELLDYINNFGVVKLAVKDEREKLINRLTELSEVVRSSSDLSDTYHKLLKAGKLLPVGFNPIDLNKKIADIKLEKLMVEQALQRLNNGGVRIDSQQYVSASPVSPKKKLMVSFAGVVSLIVGIFMAFFLEFIDRSKAKPD